MAALKLDAIPPELQERHQWVLWKTITRAGKPIKVPFQINGHEGDSSDPSKWSSYANVVEVYNKGGHDGIGYTFDPLDPYAGIDLDKCINEDGSIKPKAKAILDKLNSYSEISPSGRGIKIFCKAKLPVNIPKEGGKAQQGFIVFNITYLTYHVRIWESTILQRKGSSSGQESYLSQFL
jgi:putative DNA primase/helicase